MKHVVIAIILAISASVLSASELVETFRNPPDTARPGVYWYFMDGNQDRDEMVADLEAMKEVGIGSVLFLEVNIGVPTGPVPFMSEPWQTSNGWVRIRARSGAPVSMTVRAAMRTWS